MFRPFSLRAVPSAAAMLLSIATLPALAQAPSEAAAPAAAASAPRPAAPPAATPPAATMPPFAVVTRDAKRSDGLFTLWQKDDKVWIELKPTDFGKPFLLSPKISRGIGESGLFGGTMLSRGPFGRTQTVEFKRVHNQVQMLALNNAFSATAKTPTGFAVNAAFSPSLLGSVPVASQPHPERKTVLIELNGLFLTDLQGMAMRLNRTYRQVYSMDVRNSSIVAVRGRPELVSIETLNHYISPTILQPTPLPAGLPAGPTLPQPTTPSSLPDVRSLFFGLHYSLSALPEVPMAPRAADPRVGYFTTNVSDFSNDLARSPRQRMVNRWRLEKKDPAAELSEPVKPITFWLDRTVPLEYRQALTEGMLDWNRAFERIGFKNAVVVKQQGDDADFDTLETGVASVRWMTNSGPQFGAIGPSDVDPRSGEILDADIAFESLSSRNVRAQRSQVLVGSAAAWAQRLQASDAIAEGLIPGATAHSHVHGAECDYAEQAAEQMSYAIDVLAARGDIDPDGPEARRFVLDYLRGVAAHEVGHTLGLRHNFRSSRAYTLAQLADRAFTDANGIAGSIMEYPATNLPPPGTPFERHGNPFRGGIGPYDMWAIEYAYKPLPKANEAAELQRIAGRNGERALAYGTDEDNGLGIDPESLQSDLGDDPVAFAQRRLAIGREMIGKAESRKLDATQEFSVLRRMVTFAVNDIGRAAGVLARQIGGVRTLRDFANTGRDPLTPVDAAVQRAALDTLASGVLAADAFKLSPTLQRRLVADYLERGDALFTGEAPVQTDYNIQTVVLDMQRALLAQLMSDGVAGRIIDSRAKLAKPAEAFSLAELHSRLTRTIWSELGSAADIDAPRRELQREHVSRLSGALLRAAPGSRADARSLLRHESQALLARLQAAMKQPNKALSAEARAHLADSAESLTQALQARPVRAGV